MHHSLKNIQQWFQAVITHPDGVKSGIASVAAANLIEVAPETVEPVILPSNELTSLDRLQIYGTAYFGRLIECLKVQFPAFCHAVGEESIQAFAFSYLNQYPSMSYSLGPLGRSFDEYLSATRPPPAESSDATEPDFADFLIDLVRLERIYGEVFDGPGPESSEPLQRTDLERLSAESFAGCRLLLYGSVRLLTLRFPVHEYDSSIRQGLEPNIPSARTTYLVVTRRDYVVRRFEVTQQQFQILTAIEQKMSVGEALMRLGDRADVDLTSLQQNLKTWFEQWAAAPLFAGLEFGLDH